MAASRLADEAGFGHDTNQKVLERLQYTHGLYAARLSDWGKDSGTAEKMPVPDGKDSFSFEDLSEFVSHVNEAIVHVQTARATAVTARATFDRSVFELPAGKKERMVIESEDSLKHSIRASYSGLD